MPTNAMEAVAAIAFASSVLYAVIGNVVVLLVLRRRNAPVRGWRSGMPFYLYGVFSRLQPPASSTLRRFALSTNIGGFLAVALWLFFAGIHG
jgi:hypothetical protein